MVVFSETQHCESTILPKLTKLSFVQLFLVALKFISVVRFDDEENI